MTARLRQFVKDKKFELRDFSKYGLENVLVVIIIIIITSSGDLQPSTAIANQLPGH